MESSLVWGNYFQLKIVRESFWTFYQLLSQAGAAIKIDKIKDSSECKLNLKSYFDDLNPLELLVTNNYGTVQNAIGQLLEGSSEKFWVNSQRESGASPSLYKYDGESPFTYHVTSDNSQGSCLTYSSDQGNLYTSGANCADSKRPLCYRWVSRHKHHKHNVLFIRLSRSSPSWLVLITRGFSSKCTINLLSNFS